jgi:hypothetical protein
MTDKEVENKLKQVQEEINKLKKTKRRFKWLFLYLFFNKESKPI